MPLTSDLPEPPGLFEVPWYYDERWHQRAMSAGMISSCTFLAHSSLWSCMPRLRRYREIHPVQRPVFATQLGRRCGELLHLAPHPAVICVEKPYLGGFVEGFAQTVTGEFILVVVNGGDAPVTVDQQSIIGKLPGLEACFAMNLHKAVDARFVPLPIGLPHHCDGLHRGNLRAASEAESLIQQCRAKATPWNLRSQRLLVTPMQANRLRERYLERLSSPEFGALVRVVTTRLDFAGFLALMAEHQTVLSPPGRGHDCYRTWQALAVGTVPLVVADPCFDDRLYTNAGLPTIPGPEELTPELLAPLLQQVKPEQCNLAQLDVRHTSGLESECLRHWLDCWHCAEKVAEKGRN